MICFFSLVRIFVEELRVHVNVVVVSYELA
jgi:hypothetical protein